MVSEDNETMKVAKEVEATVDANAAADAAVTVEGGKSPGGLSDNPAQAMLAADGSDL